MAEDQKITINGKEATLEQLNEAKKNPSVKVEETAPGVYITKQRLNG